MNKTLSQINWSSTSKTGFINFRPCCTSLWNTENLAPVWRSGSMENLTQKQIETVCETLGISKWVFFGATKELRDNKLISEPRLQCISLALQEDVDFRRLIIPQKNDYLNLYWHYLTQCSEVICNFFYNLSSMDEGQRILISCYAGKDRTGIICALLCGLFTDDYQLIIEDFCTSLLYLQEQIDFFKPNWEKRNIDKITYGARFHSLEDIISELLIKIDAVYGGIIAYLLAIGVTEQVINKIRKNYKPYLIKKEITVYE